MIINHFGKRVYSTNLKNWWHKNAFKIKSLLIINLFIWGFAVLTYLTIDFSAFTQASEMRVVERVVFAEYQEMPQEIKETINYYCKLFGVDPKLAYKIVDCESKFNPQRDGDHNQPLLSKGLWQFQPFTFLSYAKKYGVKNPDINDWRDQTLIAIQMLRDGRASEWTCGRK